MPVSLNFLNMYNPILGGREVTTHRLVVGLAPADTHRSRGPTRLVQVLRLSSYVAVVTVRLHAIRRFE